MSRPLVVQHFFPSPPYSCELVEVNVQAIPAMLYALWQKSQRYFWEKPLGSDKLARKALAEQTARLLMPCGTEIVTAINQLYRLVDVSINGAVYTYEEDRETGEIIYSPEIPIVPAASDPGFNSVRWQSNDTRTILRNALLGQTTAELGDARVFRQQLDDLIAAVGADDTDIADMKAKLAILLEIIGTVAA